MTRSSPLRRPAAILVALTALSGGPALAEEPPDGGLAAIESRLDSLESRVEALERRQGTEPARLSPGARVVARGATVSDAVSWGGPLDVRGHVRGDAVALGGGVRVRRTGVVDGDAVAFGGSVQVEDGGRVLGDEVAIGGNRASAPSSGDRPLATGVARRLSALLGLAGAGVLLVGLYQHRVEGVARELARRPFGSWVLGLLALVAGAVLAVALAFTLVGIPVALVLVAGLCIAGAFGFLGACQVAGDLLPVDSPAARRILAFLVGAALLAFSGELPWILSACLAMAAVAGTGAALRSRLGSRGPGV